jgi:glutamate racemase
MTDTPQTAGKAGQDRADGRPVLVFDSGVGGMSVARAIRAAAPELPLLYAADCAGFPYGDWQPEALATHCVALVRGLVEAHRPRAVVIACNTASTLVLPPLRAVLDIPVVGTVPAVKPAAEHTRSGLVSVLATPGTVKREYTFDLIHRFASEVAVTLVGSRRLAALAEDRLAGGIADRAAIAAEIAPCFVEKDGRRTDVVVLACTHYPLLVDVLAELAPWPVEWIDPAPAIARRLVEVLGGPGAVGGRRKGGGDAAVSTDGRDLAGLLARLLAREG